MEPNKKIIEPLAAFVIAFFASTPPVLRLLDGTTRQAALLSGGLCALGVFYGKAAIEKLGFITFVQLGLFFLGKRLSKRIILCPKGALVTGAGYTAMVLFLNRASRVRQKGLAGIRMADLFSSNLASWKTQRPQKWPERFDIGHINFVRANSDGQYEKSLKAYFTKYPDRLEYQDLSMQKKLKNLWEEGLISINI